MFTLLATKEEDVTSIKNWLECKGIKWGEAEYQLVFSMVLKVDNAIKGLVAYHYKSNCVAELDFLYIDEDIRNQNYGDTVLRGLMNLLNYRGCESLIAEKSLGALLKLENFGFTYSAEGDDCLCIPDIDAFFKKPCKGHQA